MLSRVADSLYWLSRYVERAENTARVLDVQLDLSIDLHHLSRKEIWQQWESIVIAMGEEQNFNHSGLAHTAQGVAEFLAFQPSNPNSILTCIRYARENARSVREQISSEMWEHLNSLFLSVKNMDSSKMWKEGPHRFFKEIKGAAQNFHGITDATMTHSEGWEFIRVGKFLERADKTTRLLDVRHHLLQSDANRVSRLTDSLEWVAVLKSCSAFEAYRKAFNSSIEPQKIVQFLILHDAFPRSTQFSISQVADALRNITPVTQGQFVNTAQKTAGRLRADFAFWDINDIFNPGLHQFLDALQLRFNHLADAISQCYLSHSQAYPDEVEMTIQQQQ